MTMLFNTIIITYIVAINVYSFILIHTQKKQTLENLETTVKDGKLFIVGVLGGAVGIYVGTFIFKYRLNSMFLMVVMPLLIVVNAYFLIAGFLGNFGFFNNY